MYPNKLCFLIVMVMFWGMGSVGLMQPVLASSDDRGESAPTPIRFNFKGATFTQVIDFFSRTTGLPVVWEAGAPEGTLDFKAVEAYDLPEALRVLNIILQAKGVMLRVSDDMLYLQKLSEMAKENVPTFIGELPEELTDDQIITVVRPMQAALAKPLAEKLATMVASYGSVTALEQQNAIMIVETAAQARRLLKILDELDRNDPEGAVEIVKILNARAEDIMVPLKALLTVKVKKFVINQQGKQTEIEEDSMPGLNITMDVRTNSIIAKGAQHRLDKLKETIALLDVPATDGGRSMRTFVLATLSAVDASGKLEQLFAKLPEADRPTVLVLGEENKVTVVGRDATIVEAASLLKEIDGLASDPGAPERMMMVVVLDHADPGVVLGTIKGLLTRRQTEATRLATGPDGRSLVVAGIAGDVDQVKQLIQALDSPPRLEKQVRLLRLDAPDPGQTIKQAYGLYDKQVNGADPAMKLTADYDEASRLLTLAGSRKGVELFSECLRLAESHAVITRETRQVELRYARPTTISGVLTALAGQLLAPHDGSKFIAPVIEPVEALDLLVITATPDQFGVIESLVETLDRARAEDYQFRVISVQTADAQALQDRTSRVFERMTQGLDEDDQQLPEVEFDALTGNLLVSGRTESVKQYERALAEARRLMPPDRTGRMIPLRQAKAEDVLEPLRELLFKTAVPDGARFVPEPTLEAVVQTNSLFVVAEPAQHAAIEKLVRLLDTFEQAELPPLRILQVRAADANQLAAMLRKRYDSRPAEQRREKPVEISADAGTNTLIVTAHRDVYDDIREFVDGVNRSGESSAERETMIFPLKRARAVDVAAAMDKLYPLPPMPRDRRGRPMPHLQKPKEVHVSADAATNTLIVEAPVERRASFEALVEQLDRVEMPPTAQLRTYYIDRGDPVQIARTLNDLARKGVLNAPPEDRSKPVEVLIQAEPVSRTLIVAGDEVTFAKVEEVLEDLKAVPVKRDLRVIEVTGADPQEMADRALALYEEQTAEIRDAGTVSVEVDRNASVLLVVADAEAMIRFSSILNQLQATVGPQPDVRLVAIEYAEAVDIVSILDDLTRQHMDSLGHPGMAPPIFQVIERTNSILIAAQPEQHTIVRTMIQNLDRPEEQDMPPLRILQLRTADAPNLANALMRQYSQRSKEERREKPVHISADIQTNTLMIAAHPDMLTEITGIVDDLNKSNRQDYEGREIRIFPLVVARAEELAQTIDEMYPEPPMPRDRRGRPMPHLQQPREVVVRADPQTNSLIVDAPVQRMAGFEKLVEQLDRQQVMDETEVRAYHLVHADLSAVTNTLRQLAASGSLNVSGRDRRVGITISSEPVSRTVVVSGPQEIFSRVEEVLERLDGKREGLESTLRFISLRHARAETLAVVVRSLLENRVREYIPDLGDQAVNVSADGRTNTLIISAPQQVMGMAEQTIRELDMDPAAGTSRRSVRVLAIRNADASELAVNLEAVFSGDEAIDIPPTIRVDRASNTLLIRGSDEQFEMIRQVVSRIDEATIASSRQMQVIPIDPSRANAADIAHTLQRLLDRNRAGTVEVITIEELIKRNRGDDEVDESNPAKGASFMLPMSLPHQVAFLALATPQDGGSFNSLFQKKKPVVKDAEGSDITIAVDPETNNLIVVGSPRMVERALELARQLQDEIPAAPGKIRYIPLPTGMDALNISRLVNQVLSQMTPPGGRRGDLRRRVGVLVDRPANAIVVTASDHDFLMVGELIAAMSQPAASEEFVVKVYPLQSITSDRALNRIQILLGTGSQPRRGRQPSGFGNIAMRLWGNAFSLKAEIDPRRIRVSSDTQNNSLMVMAPAESIAFLDRFISMLDKAPVNVQSTLKMYALHHAKATDLRRTLRQVFLARFRTMQRQAARTGVIPMQPEFAADDRTNTLLVTASPEQLAEIDNLLADLDDELGNDRQPLVVIELKAALPGQAAVLLNKVVIGSDQQRRAETLIVPDDQSGVLMVRASEAVMEEIKSVLKEIDREAAREYEIRTITLERADAGAVAQAIQRFYDDRARIASSGRGRRAQTRRVSIIGDHTSNTLMIAASEEKFDEIQTLVKQFDTPQANQSWTFRVYPLENAKATEIQRTVQQLLTDLTWGQGPIFFFGGRNSGQNSRNRGQIAVRADARLNALIVTGGGDKFDLIENLIEVLDAPPSRGEERLVRLYRVEHANLNMVAEVVRELFTDTSQARRWWEPADPREVKIRTDMASRTLIVSGTGKEHADIAALIEEVDGQIAPPEQQIEVLALKFAQARELARTLTQFVNSRARVTNQPRGLVTIAASDSANALIVSADPENLVMLKEMLAQLDQPDATGERVIEIIALADGDAAEIARILTQQFGRRGRGQARVVVTPDARTNSLIINAPRQEFAQAKLLIEQLDGQAAADETIIRTYALTGAQADEAQRILRETLQLDARGETKGIIIKLDDDPDAVPVEVKAKIVSDPRSNSLIVTATAESFPVIESLIERLDTVPAVNPVEYRIIPLEHAMADSVAFTLEEMARGMPRDQRPQIDYNRLENHLIIAATADQFEQLQQIIAELDQPPTKERTTDFVPLQFAEAEQIREALSVFYGSFAPEADTPGKLNVRIVADPASNSLVITAAEEEWAGIRELLAKLDSEEYDSSLQHQVMPLRYADAGSVARAINEAFAGTIERRNRGDRGGRQQSRNGGSRDAGENRRDMQAPSILVESEEWVRASAEEITNAVIVSASRKNMGKIERIINELDVADYATMPPPRLIPVQTGDPVKFAETLRGLYEQQRGTRGGDRGTRSLRIVGDKHSNTIIVRADDDEFAQISALAEALEQEASSQGLAVHVLAVERVPAARVATAIRKAFMARASQAGQPLSIQVDSRGNTLVIASTGGLFEEIKEVVAELDALSPSRGQGIFIIELENISPEKAKQMIQTIGLDRPQREDSNSKLVTEPITVSALSGRNALLVVANPADKDTIVGLLKALDAAPGMAEARVRVVRLNHAEAGALAGLLTRMFNPSDQQSGVDLAKQVAEQVRRLAVRRDGLDEPDLSLDLTIPIRIIPNAIMNALIISSSPENVEAVEELVKLLDELPITEAVTVQFFPLENIAADEFARIVNDLFRQGKNLGRVPGTNLRGVPGGITGKALLDEIALTVDDRTNTVIVAGKEESVALVEVLVRRVDADVVMGWVEPKILPLRYADATDLAELLHAIVVEGTDNLPQSSPLQRQTARLRMARIEDNGGQVLESEVFFPMTRLLILPESQLNALILMGTPVNLDIVTELVGMLDIEQASPSATVRIYPVEHASAARLATILESLFQEQVNSKAIRPEDRVIVKSDDRSNALIVTTSPRSFAVLEGLLKTLDAEIAPDLRAIRRIPVIHASATRLARLIQQLMDARLERLRKVQPETADLERATIIADPRTNSLVIAAGNESYEVIKRLAEDLDESKLTDTSLVQVIVLEHGNPDRIADAVRSIMERRYADLPAELRKSQSPLILTDPRTNSLLVAANPEDYSAIEDLVNKLERTELNPAVGLHVLALDPTSRAEPMATKLQRLMRDREQTLGDARTPSDRVTIEPDAASNSLIVAANEENLQVVRELIRVLAAAETEAATGREVEVLTLATSRATDIVDMLNDLYVDEANRTRGTGVVQVTADERLNAVLIKAPGRDIKALRRLVAQLDGAKPATVVEIKYVPLNSANALETVSLIEDVLSGRGIGPRRGRRGQQATILRYLREISGEDELGDEETGGVEIEVSAAIREAITLTPDLRTNTVIVSAPREAIGMIEKMIRDLDSSSIGAKNIRIYKLKNADAVAMAEILTDLFNLRQGNTLNVLKPRETPGRPTPGSGAGDGGIDSSGAGGGGLSGVELTTIPDERQRLSITVDSRTNSLIVSGSPTYLDLVSQVVDELDELDANEREVFVYQLRNAVAGEVADVIGSFVQQEQQKLINTLSPDQIGSAARILEREITIQGDDNSNTVLVSASPRYMDTVKRMIEELDVDPPQVLIQVMLAEVTIDNTDEWGVDFKSRVRTGSTNILGDFGLASAFVGGLGVPSMTIASTDFQMIIRAMASTGRLQVLSNPSVMAANNAPARIQVGETIRIPSSTSVSDAGQTNSTVSPEDIGVILEVTPSINPDGFVRMDIHPEISSLSQRTTQISETFQSPIITKRTVDTTVTVYDGQTIVIGGLISDRFETRFNKVPFLGDLPLIGGLFRSEVTERAKTELLIVLTPYVITSPAELHQVGSVTDALIDQLSVPDEVKASIRHTIESSGGGLFDAEGNRLDGVPQLDPPAVSRDAPAAPPENPLPPIDPSNRDAAKPKEGVRFNPRYDDEVMFDPPAKPSEKPKSR